MPAVKRIEHIAILVEDIEKTMAFWQEGLGLELAGVKELPAEKSRVAFLPVGGSQVELVQPTSSDSGLARFLEKRGPGMHHLCLEVDDIAGMLVHLKSLGTQLINETPVIASDGKQYAFIHPKSANGVMVELYELPKDLNP